VLSLAAERTTTARSRQWHHDWVVEVTSAAPRLRVRNTASGASLVRADDERIAVLFAGVLVNAREIDAEASQTTAADLVRRAFHRDGIAVVRRLRGPFAVFILERGSDRLWVARDQVGQQPLYLARTGTSWLFSGSPIVLDGQPGVRSGPDPVALSEYLCGWYPSIASTGYRGVERVAPATIVRIEAGRESSERYWDPSPEDEAIEWLTKPDLDRFDETFARAVERTTQTGRAAVFLSGGLDSIAVATAATDRFRASGGSAPYAVSLAFPDAASNEQTVQAGVAGTLGLGQTIVPFDEAVGPEGLVARALAMSAEWPVPMWDIWAPAYERLALIARDQERTTVLTGRGGDEWLTITPYLAADLVAKGDLVGVARLLAMRRRSQNLRGARAHARLLWLTAARPLASAALDAVAPRTWHGQRRKRLLAERPSWVAPDPQVRRAMDERVEQWIAPARPRQGFYVREMRTALLHPAVTQDLEETQEFGRRLGLTVLHPFWDVDLVELLYRAPPKLLMGDGRSKWLLRRRLTQRFPGLGLEHRGKVSARGVFRNLMQRQATLAWQRLGGVRALTELGIVSSSGVQSMLAPMLDAGPTQHTGRVWELLTLETWVRQRFGVK
jgi:asparagine synthetase B (glutamine-hydrolysing)